MSHRPRDPDTPVSRPEAVAADHGEIELLLPWYVNQTLDDTEIAWVESHLAECAECRAEVEASRDLAQALRASALAAPFPHPGQLARLRARIDAAEEGRLSRRLRAAQNLLGSWPRPARWLLAGQLAAILILAAALGVGNRSAAPPTFHTLSDRAEPPARTAELRVVFADDASEKQIRELLLEIRAEIVAGPSPLGAYTLKLARQPEADPLPVVLAHLRAQRTVRFAEELAP
ncbi:MAG: zf-HC2 domain-containing protein [Thermoanaerobaculia bacterium]